MKHDIEFNTKKDHDYGYEPDTDEDNEEEEINPLDSIKSQALLSKLLEWRQQARIAHADNRIEQALDEDYYDGLQWSQDEIDALEERGQAPLVFNEIKPAIDWIIGTEKRTRVDWNVLPRNEDDSAPAESKKKLLKYISDVNKAAFERSRAFADAIKVGVGWLEDGIRGDESDELLFSRKESWRNVWYDHMSTSYDLADARFLIREKFTDLDISEAMFPERKEQLKQASYAADLYSEQDDEFYDSALYYKTDSQGRPVGRHSTVDDATYSVNNRRERVKLIEMWYREPCACKVARVNIPPMMDMQYRNKLEIMRGQEYDENNQDMMQAVNDGYASLFDTIKMKVRCAMFVENAMLQDMPSPYKHDRFPLTPIWCYRRARDNAPYGVIRNQRDPQSDLNKQRSKAQFILSVNQVIMEKGAVEDKEDLREEAAAPDGIIEYKAGKKLEFRKDIRLAEEHVMLQRQDGEYIRQVSGVTGENLGQETNATSGKAIQARQMQGSVTTAEPFDNLRFAMQIQGENQLSMAEQFYTDPKVVRITGDRGHREYLRLNDPVQNDDGYIEVENDITSTKADFIIDEQDYQASTRAAMFETMMAMVGNLAQLSPDIALSFLDLVIDMSDIPGKDELVNRIRQITGQSDPDDDSGEAEAKQQAKEEADTQQAQIDSLLQDLAIMKEKLEVKKLGEEADQSRIKTMSNAVEVAEKIVNNPEVAAVADSLAESGEIQ